MHLEKAKESGQSRSECEQCATMAGSVPGLGGGGGGGGGTRHGKEHGPCMIFIAHL
jgi:hypothetical protein